MVFIQLTGVEAGDILLGFLLSIVFFAVGSFVALTCYLKRLHAKYAHLPGPKRTSFFTGNVNEVRRAKRRDDLLVELLLRWVKENGETFHFFLYNRPIVFTTSPENVKLLLCTKDIPKSEIMIDKLSFSHGTRFLGRGISSEIDNQVASRRKAAINLFFHKNGSKDLMRSTKPLNEVGDALVYKITESLTPTDKEVNMTDVIHRAALDAICSVCFDMELDSLTSDQCALLTALSIVTRDTKLDLDTKDFSTSVRPWRTREEKRFVAACTLLRETACYVLSMRDAKTVKEEDQKGDLLTQIIKMRRKNKTASPYVYIDDFVNILVSGVDSTANATLLALMQVSKHPHVLKRMQDEISEQIGERRHVTVDTLQRMEYTQSVIRETVRLHPPRSILFRRTNEEVGVGMTMIPNRTDVLLSSYVSSRLNDHVPDAESFKPERFINGSKLKPQPNTCFPFSLGSRNCPGQHLAMLTSSMLLVKLIQSFTLEFCDDQSRMEVREFFNLEPRQDVICTVTSRNKTEKRSDLNDNSLGSEAEE